MKDTQPPALAATRDDVLRLLRAARQEKRGRQASVEHAVQTLGAELSRLMRATSPLIDQKRIRRLSLLAHDRAPDRLNTGGAEELGSAEKLSRPEDISSAAQLMPARLAVEVPGGQWLLDLTPQNIGALTQAFEQAADGSAIAWPQQIWRGQADPSAAHTELSPEPLDQIDQLGAWLNAGLRPVSATPELTILGHTKEQIGAMMGAGMLGAGIMNYGGLLGAPELLGVALSMSVTGTALHWLHHHPQQILRGAARLRRRFGVRATHPAESPLPYLNESRQATFAWTHLEWTLGIQTQWADDDADELAVVDSVMARLSASERGRTITAKYLALLETPPKSSALRELSAQASGVASQDLAGSLLQEKVLN